MDWYNRKITRTADLKSSLMDFKAEEGSLDYAIVGDQEDKSRGSQTIYVTATFLVSSDAYVIEEIDDLKNVPELFLEDPEFERKLADAVQTGGFEDIYDQDTEIVSVTVKKLKPGPSGMGYKAVVEVYFEHVINGSPATGPYISD